MKFSQALLDSIAKVDGESWMVAAYLTDETNKKLSDFWKSLGLKNKVDKVLDAKELHCTLRYFDKDEFDDVDKLIKALKGSQELYISRDCVEIKPKKLKLLGEDNAVIIELESSSIKEIQKKVDKIVQDVGGPPSDFPKFIPHISLVYGFDGKEKELPDRLPDFDIKFKNIALVDNDDVVHWSGD